MSWDSSAAFTSVAILPTLNHSVLSVKFGTSLPPSPRLSIWVYGLVQVSAHMPRWCLNSLPSFWQMILYSFLYFWCIFAYCWSLRCPFFPALVYLFLRLFLRFFEALSWRIWEKPPVWHQRGAHHVTLFTTCFLTPSGKWNRSVVLACCLQNLWLFLGIECTHWFYSLLYFLPIFLALYLKFVLCIFEHLFFLRKTFVF